MEGGALTWLPSAQARPEFHELPDGGQAHAMPGNSRGSWGRWKGWNSLLA